jgi:hypothetical protein
VLLRDGWIIYLPPCGDGDTAATTIQAMRI